MYCIMYRSRCRNHWGAGWIAALWALEKCSLLVSLGFHALATGHLCVHSSVGIPWHSMLAFTWHHFA